MKSEHPSQSDLERYVSDDLDEETARNIEAHVESCEACANALSNEARIEVELHAAASEEKSPRIKPISPLPIVLKPRRRAPVIALVTAFAAAAAVVLLVSRATRDNAPNAPKVIEAISASEPSNIRITCDASGEGSEQSCRERARCTGQFIEDRADGVGVPRYEKSLAECNRAPGLRGSQKGSL